jgi:hypothetical protein
MLARFHGLLGGPWRDVEQLGVEVDSPGCGPMKALLAAAALATTLLGLSDRAGSARSPGPDRVPAGPITAVAPEDLTRVVGRVCVTCHNSQLLTGNLSLEGFRVEAAAASPEVAERMIRKLRAGMMPPPGIPRPGGDTLDVLVQTLEELVDAAAAREVNPGRRTFQRLNRAEYERSIRDLLELEIDAGAFLPLDTKSDNFDNIADVQLLSPTLLSGYLNAAAEISRLALGDPAATSNQTTYTLSSYISQVERVEGAPFGSRGGISVVHNFPADGEYAFSATFAQTATGEGFFGQIAPFEALDVSINGERVALLPIDQWMRITEPGGIVARTEPVFVRAGPQRVSAAFDQRAEGPVVDLIAPHEWSLADRDIGIEGYGLTLLPHLKDFVIAGPASVTGVSETPSRRKILTCRPALPAEERPCAESVLSRLGAEAYRRPLTPGDRQSLMSLFDAFAADGGFEIGLQRAIQGLLASPHFVFRLETAPRDVKPGEAYRLSDIDLASRLSFFLWGAAPDAELMTLAQRGRLSDQRVLEGQVRRMLAHSNSGALATRFAAQWLRLQDLDKVNPDQFWFPDYDHQLASAMRQETELFFNNLISEDRSFLELFEADYTFVNERLAHHYGIPGVVGPQFRRVSYLDDSRRGILGHGSVLVLTSHANRTSPVLRGKWVMEVLLGTPPPPPPPGVPDLEETKGSDGGRMLTTRERMEMHRASTVCRSCHMFMDPIGLALDNFDVTGKWRIRENGVSLDTRGVFYDGTPVESPADLRRVLLKRPTPLVRTFTENLMAYALGRRAEYYDRPTVRAIVRDAARDDYRMSAFILGVVKSDAFQMKRAAEMTSLPSQESR